MSYNKFLFPLAECDAELDFLLAKQRTHFRKRNTPRGTAHEPSLAIALPPDKLVESAVIPESPFECLLNHVADDNQ